MLLASIDFRRSLQDILARFRPNRLLIEASGVSDPHDILSILNEAQFGQGFNLTKTVTVVDADFREVARENREGVFYNQIKAADLVLLNKVDLQPVDLVTRFIFEIQQVCPSSSIKPTYRCRIDPDALQGLQKEIEHRVESLFTMYMEDSYGGCREPRHGASNARELGYVTFSFETSFPWFCRFMASAPAQLYRIKGYVFFGGRLAFVNHVGGKTEWAYCGAKDYSRLAFVGWQVDEKTLLARLKGCLVE
jgi:G3E family GTPase